MLTKRELLSASALSTTALAASRFAPVLAQTDRLSFLATAAIAEAGFIYGLPIVMNYEVMYKDAVDHSSDEFEAPFNRIKSEGRVFTYEDTDVRSPNCDTPHSVMWMDLRTEPLVLSVPSIDPKRYYSVLLCDGNLNNYGCIGSRTTGSEAGTYMVVGPGWNGNTPSSIKKVLRSTTQFSIASYRTQLFDREDIDNVSRVEAEYRVETLSKYLNQPPPRPAQTISFPKISDSQLRRNFFEYLAFALQLAPAQFVEAEIRSRLARIGVGPGRTFTFSDLSLKERLEMILGMKEGDRKIDRAIKDATVALGGWRVVAFCGGNGFYDGNWLLRAACAKAAIYGDDPQEAVCLFTPTSAEGEALDGGKRTYAITFPPGQLPPVNAFWSLTMYDGTTQLLSKNPMNRYLINSSMLPTMKADADGGLTVYIQHKSPGVGKEANWLPAPSGPISLGLRLYWPKTQPPSILPIGKGSWHPPVVETGITSRTLRCAVALDDRFQEGCHMAGIHLAFRAPT